MNPPPAAPEPLLLPRYGEASLADVMPSVLAALQMGGDDRLGLVPAQRVVVLLVDGLGARALAEHASAAPYLTAHPRSELTAGFPSTTATSLASLSTGRPAGRHGITGYTSWVPDVELAVNWLAWRPVGAVDDLREQLVPEDAQPEPTVWETAAEAGVATTIATSRSFAGTGLTRAVFRGGRFAGGGTPGHVLALAADAADRGHRSLVYTYVAELDYVGHGTGPGTDAWSAQLALVDRHAELLADRLPPGTLLLVTADHGMARLDLDGALDADADRSPLRDGVRALAGEPRARYVHAVPGAAADVLATWTATLGDGAWVLSGDEAVSAGLFGPEVTPTARARIGDVVAISRGELGVVQRKRESRQSSMPGHHGGLTAAELLVPLVRISC